MFNVSTTNGYTLAEGLERGLDLGLGARVRGLDHGPGRGPHHLRPAGDGRGLDRQHGRRDILQLSGNLSEAASAPQSSLILSGAGLVIFSGTGSYTGNTSVNGGTLQIIAGGQLPAYNEYVAAFGNARVVQTGGTNYASNYLYVGSGANENGSYCLSGGLLSAGWEFIGYYGVGSFAQSGGTNTANLLFVGAANQGSYSLSGGLLSINSTEIIGGSQSQYSGSFSQTGGSNVTNLLSVGASGNGAAAYSLSGASQLSAQYEYIGSYSQSGIFTQWGGSNAVGQTLYVGTGNGGSTGGTYNLSGGNLSAGLESVGQDTSGIFTQTGGTNTAGSLVLAQNSGASGTYNLNGGLLSISGLSQGSGSAAFNFGGGTFQAAASFLTSVPITLSTAGSNGVFDSNGNSLTLAGPLSGPGGLQKVGAGALTLAAANTYAGPTTLNAGMLVAANGMTLSATSTGTVTLNGGTLAAGRGRRHDQRPGGSGQRPAHHRPGAALPSGYGTLNLIGGLTTNANTTLLFNTGGQVAQRWQRQPHLWRRPDQPGQLGLGCLPRRQHQPS